MLALLAFFGLVIAGVQQWASEEERAQYDADVLENRDLGLTEIGAHANASMELLDRGDGPYGKMGRVYDRLWSELPDEAKDEYANIISGLETDKLAFDARMAELDAGYEQRITDVMGLIEDKGAQAVKDITKAFGQAKGSALSDLTARGLAGSGVGASVGAGFATGEADALARSREQVADIKASALSSLTGEKLAFGANAAQFGAGFDQNIAGQRMNALTNVTNLELAGGLGYANFLGGMGDRFQGVLDTQHQEYLDWLESILPEPPPPSQGFGNMFSFGSILNEGGVPGNNRFI